MRTANKFGGKVTIAFIYIVMGLFSKSLWVQAQDNSAGEKLSAFIKNINTFNYLNPQEKVYLHFDNTAYYTGENIWYKAYVVTTERNKPSQLSKTLYVELLGPDGNILETKKVKLKNGQGHGDFLIRSTVKSGYYEVRAYTRYMLNFGSDNVFSRVFPIFSSLKKQGNDTVPKIPSVRHDLLSQREKPFAGKSVNLSFYPESGSPVAGLPSKVAFKAVGEQGENLDIEGTVYNQRNELVAFFKTLHQGMGIFEYVPEPGMKYKASITYKKKEYTFNLTEAQALGYVLNVNTQDQNYLHIRLQKSEEIPSDSIGISVSCRGKVYFFDAITLASDIPFDLRLQKEELPAGVIQISVFDTDGNVFAERLAFNNRAKFASLATAKKEWYAPFEKISLLLELKEETGLPAESSFSLAVRDAGTEMQTPCQDNIMTSLLLSSEIRGYVENPAYYFETDDRNRRLKLDLLMMVQGWRRYDWKQMAGTRPFEQKHPIEKGILVEGTILSQFRNKNQENIEVTQLLTRESKSTFLVNSCITDSAGGFNFLHDIDGDWNMTLQTKKKDKRKDYHVLLHRNFSPAPQAYPFMQVKASAEFQKQATTTHKTDQSVLVDSSHVRSFVLPEVEINKKRDSKKNNVTGMANVMYDVRLEIDKIRDAGGLEATLIYDFLSELNPYFTYRIGDIADPTVLYCWYKGRKVIFVVDNNAVGSNFSVYSKIDQISVRDIESIYIVEDNLVSFEYLDIPELINETIKGDKNLLIAQNNVIVFIYTNKEGTRHKGHKGIRTTKLAGYSTPSQFYHVDYRYGIPANEQDYRRTLYWNPDVKMDNEGKASIHFYNNSSCREIIISAEGLTDEGVPIILESK